MFKYITEQKILMALFIGLMVTGVSMQYLTNVKADIQESVVRLHVIANSDTEEDQQLKLKVRDSVINYLKDKLDDAKDTQETKDIILRELQNIADAARDEIDANGYRYGVSAELGSFDFPTKQYENAQLPSGKYDALRIVIGSGEGENWWCVLFPQLCFASSSSTKGAMSEESSQKLKNVLTEDEYNIVVNSQDGDIPVKIKFRLLEIFGR